MLLARFRSTRDNSLQITRTMIEVPNNNCLISVSIGKEHWTTDITSAYCTIKTRH
jgi:hypothetical protein